MSQPLIRKAIDSDIQEILVISSSSFGEDYIKHDQLNSQIYSSHSGIYVLVIEREICGFLLFQLMQGKEVFEHFPLITQDFNSGKTLVIRTIAIDKNHCRKGYAEALLNYAINESTQDVQEVISINWKTSGAIPFQKTCEKLGFKESIELKNYWKDDSLKRNYSCIECGSPPCRCNAIIFRKRIRPY